VCSSYSHYSSHLGCPGLVYPYAIMVRGEVKLNNAWCVAYLPFTKSQTRLWKLVQLPSIIIRKRSASESPSISPQKLPSFALSIAIPSFAYASIIVGKMWAFSLLRSRHATSSSTRCSWYTHEFRSLYSHMSVLVPTSRSLLCHRAS
jgi:hypothetical protein